VSPSGIDEAGDELAVVGVGQQRLRLAERDPAHLVDLVVGLARVDRDGLHEPPANPLGTSLAVDVAVPVELAQQPPADAGLLEDLAQRGLLPGLAPLELALRQRPVVVAGAVHHEHLAVAHDDAACGADLSHGHDPCWRGSAA
jgi:hypothetical protein